MTRLIPISVELSFDRPLLATIIVLLLLPIFFISFFSFVSRLSILPIHPRRASFSVPFSIPSFPFLLLIALYLLHIFSSFSFSLLFYYFLCRFTFTLMCFFLRLFRPLVYLSVFAAESFTSNIFFPFFYTAVISSAVIHVVFTLALLLCHWAAIS